MVVRSSIKFVLLASCLTLVSACSDKNKVQKVSGSQAVQNASEEQSSVSPPPTVQARPEIATELTVVSLEGHWKLQSNQCGNSIINLRENSEHKDLVFENGAGYLASSAFSENLRALEGCRINYPISVTIAALDVLTFNRTNEPLRFSQGCGNTANLQTNEENEFERNYGGSFASSLNSDRNILTLSKQNILCSDGTTGEQVMTWIRSNDQEIPISNSGSEINSEVSSQSGRTYRDALLNTASDHGAVTPENVSLQTQVEQQANRIPSVRGESQAHEVIDLQVFAEQAADIVNSRPNYTEERLAEIESTVRETGSQ